MSLIPGERNGSVFFPGLGTDVNANINTVIRMAKIGLSPVVQSASYVAMTPIQDIVSSLVKNKEDQEAILSGIDAVSRTITNRVIPMINGAGMMGDSKSEANDGASSNDTIAPPQSPVVEITMDWNIADEAFGDRIDLVDALTSPLFLNSLAHETHISIQLMEREARMITDNDGSVPNMLEKWTSKVIRSSNMKSSDQKRFLTTLERLLQRLL